MKNLKRGFTLVELIVVITILAILGSIAFISLQGYSADARNSKRTSDLGSLESAMSTQLAEGQDIMSFANTASDTKNRLSNPQIAGTTTTTGTDYNAGPINYTALPVKSTDFQDPMGGNYVVGVTSRKDGKHELSATVEQGAGSKIAKILGDYTSRGITTYGITYVSSNLVNITNSTDLNRFFPGDTVVTNGTTPTACTIIKISSDGKSLTLSGTGAPSDATTIRLNAPETTGLIDTYAAGTQGNIVIDGGSSYLPYSY